MKVHATQTHTQTRLNMENAHANGKKKIHSTQSEIISESNAAPNEQINDDREQTSGDARKEIRLVHQQHQQLKITYKQRQPRFNPTFSF